MPYRRRIQPPPIEPITLISRGEPFDHPDWVFEPKYDGFRGLLYLTRRTCELRSRRAYLFRQFEPLRTALAEQLKGKELVLDGEVVALDPAGRPKFGDLLRGEGQLAYAAFDLLWLNGEDLRDCPLMVRKRALDRLIPKNTPWLRRVLQVKRYGIELFDAARRLDLEGIVAKRRQDPYRPGTVWFKIKNPEYSQAEGRWELFERRRR